MAKKDELVILHIAVIDGVPARGVECVVPNHVQYQSSIARVGLLNCGELDMKAENNKYKVFHLKELKTKKIQTLEEPFNKPDLIVFHSVYYPIFLKLAKEAQKLGVPYVVIPHGCMTQKAQQKSKWKKIIGNALLFNCFLQNAVAVQYLCKEEKRDSKPINKSSIISGNGIEISQIKKEYKQNSKPFEIIYIGRYMIYHKGLDLLVDAICDIKEEMKKRNMILSMYGVDYDDAFKHLIEEKKLEEVIQYHGPIYGQEKIQKLLNADLFIQTSRHEGQPLGVMEAIALGLPTILTRGTNFGEIVQKEKIGWLVEFEKEELGEKIIQAYEKKEILPEMSRMAIEYAKENFSWDKIAQNTIKTYKGLVDKKSDTGVNK